MKKAVMMLSLIVFYALTSCKNKKAENLQPEQTFSIGDKLTLGQFEEYASVALNQNSPKIVLSSTVGKLPNLSLEIQPNSFEGSNLLKISLADIKNSKLGDDFKALTPLIQIESEQNISRNGLTVSIPITLPEGHFAAAFAVGEDGDLHILPLLNLFDNQIQTFLFDLNYQQASAKNMRTARATGYANITKLIVFAVKQDRLSSAVGSSKYTPGIDDWEFANYGSSYTRGGNCFGMTVTSLWYYLFERHNSGNLFGNRDLGLFVATEGRQVNQFAPTPVTKDALWFDNKFGIRLVTVIQQHQLVDEVNKIRENYENIVSKSIDAIHDRQMYNLVSYHYLVSDEPLLLGCYGNGGAHGVLVIVPFTSRSRPQGWPGYA